MSSANLFKRPKGYVKIDLILSLGNKKHLTNLFLCLLSVFFILKLNLF